MTTQVLVMVPAPGHCSVDLVREQKTESGWARIKGPSGSHRINIGEVFYDYVHANQRLVIEEVA